MKTRQRIQKAEADVITSEVAPGTNPGATHRLTQIEVNEVSIVDRAANKRRYLVVKEQQKDDTKVEAKVEKAPEVMPPSPPVAPGTPTPPTLRISPELKSKVLGILRSAQERIGVISEVLAGSSETPGAPAPKELMDALAQLSTLLSTTPATKEGETPEADKTKTPETPEATAKAGRKISAARLNQLKGAHELLSSLLAEVTAADAKGDAEQPADEGAEKPGTVETEKAATPPAPSPELVEMKEQVSGVVDAINKMAKIFELQSQRIEHLSKARGESRQPDVDAPRVKPTAERVVWDLDMASPLKPTA
jgi:hypothetical protein